MTAAASPPTPRLNLQPAFAGHREPDFDVESLRDLCDSVRVSLRKDKTLGHRADEVKKLFLAVVKGECTGSTALPFDTVRDAHLDKLLEDMLDSDMAPATAPDEFRANSKIARSLQKQWQIRFQGDYFRIDHERISRLLQYGRLRDLEFVGPRAGNCELWQTKFQESILAREEEQTFQPGHWWLNLACAHRDGIVGSVREQPTKGRYDIAALPLMTGREDIYPSRARYCRRGTMADMHLPLMTRVGKEIRILRGHGLHSPIAPKGGVRFDGTYIIRKYGVWRPKPDVLELELELERVSTERHMKEVVDTPSPSELDDWKLYEKYENELVRQREGSPVFMDWYAEKAKRQGERDHWRRLNELRLDPSKLWDMSRA